MFILQFVLFNSSKILSDEQYNGDILYVYVNGLVCDFCARGIEKTFVKDKAVKRIDVDLESGKVLIAYTKDKEIDFDEIKSKILANGQNAIDFSILNI